MSILTKCLESIGYRSFTDFQKTSFKAIFKDGFSVILVAPTGSGKTEAAVLPVMYDIRVNGLKPVSAIYVTPLRALNRDIEERISRLASCFDIRVALKHGDTPPSVRRSIVRNPPHILVTTPESFVYILVDDKLRRFIVNLEYVVFDEFRELMDSKRGYLLLLLTYFFEKMFLKRNLRKIALTATLKNEDYARMILSGSTLPYKTVVIREKYEKSLDIEVFVPEPNGNELDRKVRFVIDKILSNRGTLIFTNTRSLAEKLGFLIRDALDKLGYGDVEVGVHHGSLSLTHRVGVEKGFKNGSLKGLVATSSMELGVDIGNVDYVVQFGSPRQATRLLQRIGRSGHRLGSVSRGAVVVKNNVLQVLESIVLIRRAKSQDLEVEKLYEYPLDVLAYAIVVLTHVFPEGIGLNDIYSVLINHPQYINLDYSSFAKLVDYLVEARLIALEDNVVKPRKKGLIYIRRTNMIPETRDYRVVDLASNREVGVLNEEYVLLDLVENDYMILAGEPWRVVSIDHDKCLVYVEKPVIDESGYLATPHWEGENIPVEYSVAREVGSLIRRLKGDVIPREYMGFADVLRSVSRRACDLGDDSGVVICSSRDDGLIVINLYGGDRVNRFFRDFLKKSLDAKYPEIKARVYSNPYVIVIVSDKLSNEFILDRVLSEVENVFRNLKELLSNESLIHSVAKSSTNYLWRIYQVAQRFGAIDPRVHRVTRRILEAFSETVIGDEALREVLHRDYDISSLTRLVESFHNRSTRVVVKECPKIFLKEVLEYNDILRVPSLMYSSRDSYRERVLNRRVRLMCLNCGWLIEGRVGDFLGKFSYKCGRCGYRALTIVKSDLDTAVWSKSVRGEKLDPGEFRRIEDLRVKNSVLNVSGDLGLIILSARGVSASDAKFVLDRVRRGEDLFSILYEYEKRVVKYRRYFD